MKRGVFWLGIVISLFFLYLALRGLDLPQVWGSIRDANLIWLIPAVVVYFIDVAFRSLRWQILLRPAGRFHFKDIFRVIAIGYLGNNIFPARAGELMRTVILKRRYQLPILTSLATIVVERVFDAIVMLGFIFFNLGALRSLPTSSGLIGTIQSLALWAAILFLGVLLIFFLAAFFPSHAERILTAINNRLMPGRWRPSAAEVIRRFLSGLDALRSPRHMLLVWLSSLAVWLFETLTYYFVMRAFPFTVSLFALMLMNGILNLATLIPSAPGYIGTFDAISKSLFETFGISSTIAAGYTVVLHATLWLPITLAGAYFFAREGLDWSRELKQAREEKEDSQ